MANPIVTYYGNGTTPTGAEYTPTYPFMTQDGAK